MGFKRLHSFLIHASVLFLLWGFTSAQSDCNNNGCCSPTSPTSPGGYKPLNEPRRSINSKLQPGNPAICDRALTRGWYRFTSFAGGKMPTQYVAERHCGTVHPIWMEHDLHPKDKGITIDAKACINFFGNCAAKLDIKVRKCNGYYVYNLGPTYSCSLAYCAGNKTPCPYGLTGQPPNCNEKPKKFDSKHLEVPTIRYKPKEDKQQIAKDVTAVSLLCEVELKNGIEQWKNVTYKIEWFSEGKRLQNATVVCVVGPNQQTHNESCPGRTVKTLVSTLIPGNTYKAGMWITCNVSAKFTHPQNNDWSSPKEVREPFYVGIKVYPATLRLRSGSIIGGGKIKIKPTVPVRRNSEYDPPYLEVTFALPKNKRLKIKNNRCKIALKGMNEEEVEIEPDFPAPDETVVIIVEMKRHGTFWMDTTRTIWVSVLSSDVQRCKTFTDPHYYGMDKQTITRYFDFHGHGEFILYKNTEKKFEVQTRQWACNNPGTITCNCGVVLRDHNDVIEFSCCNPERSNNRATTPTPLKLKIRSKKCLRPGISIDWKVNGVNIDYAVTFPTGVKVELQRNEWGIDVTVLTSREPNSKESGICMYDKSLIDQIIINDFGTLQRINNPSENLFDFLPPHVDDSKTTYQQVCSCVDTKECFANNLFIPSFFNNNLKPLDLCDRRGRRDISYTDDLSDEDYELFMKPHSSGNHHRLKRALPNPVVPMENATRYCVEKIADTKVGKLCAKVGVNVQAFVNSCSVDIAMTGEFSFAIGIASLLMNECGYVAAINVSSSKNESSENPQGVASIANEIAEMLCPNDCAFNGQCVNGSCICNKDYTADDCSISIYQRPSIFKLQRDGLCNKRAHPCKKVTVLGTGWLNSTNITCHLQEFKVVNSSWTPNKTEHTLPGVMTDLVLVDCLLPDSPVMEGHFDENIEGTSAAGLVISVSNDGVHKSKENLTFISYDAACMSCNVSTGCYLKDNSCFINRYCFAPNEVNPKDWCSQCLPDVDKNSWSDRRVNQPPNITSKSSYFALQGENLQLVIDTFDPEGMPVTVSLMDGSPVEALMYGNVLHWNVTANQSTAFYLKVTDACLASSTFNFTVSLVECQCKNNGSCTPATPRGSGYYSCLCLPGFTGRWCKTNIDDCEAYPCIQGRCVDGINTYTCICYPGYVGRNCDKDYDNCQPSPCLHGRCTDYVNGYTCTCDPGYSGENCNIDIDECQSSPCSHGTCIDQVNGFNCQCDDGYTGAVCDVNINECQSSPCINGSCVDKVNGFSCICQAGFSGLRCEVDINECLQVSCGNGSCIDQVNNYSCICNAGFTGHHCDVVITHCSNDSCYPGVPCTENSNIISCGSCPSGFTGDGKNCKDIDDCVNHTCANGGSCVDGVNSYSCICKAGYTSYYCETDIDDCVNHTCANGGSCVDGVNSYSCICKAGYTSYHCETDLDDCANRTCANGGSCVDGVNMYTCNCSVGYTGDHCETDIDDCINHTCANGGSCADGVNSYTCACLTGYTGDKCETDIDDCINHTCANGGSCADGVNSYTCACLTGYTGDKCETALKTTVTTEASSSESTSAPSTPEEVATTKRPTEEVSDERKIVFTLEIRVNEDWDEQLKDKSSEKFKELSKLLKEEIWKAYSGNSELKEVEIISMRSGSIIADFKLTFKTSLTVKEAMAPLKKETANGKLGSLRVDPDSLKSKISKQDVKKEKESSTSNLPFVIGISCGSFVAFTVVTICIVSHCKRSSVRSRSNSRIGDGMPADESCLKSEKYELQSRTKTKGENIIWVEEKGVWNDGME